MSEDFEALLVERKRRERAEVELDRRSVRNEALDARLQAERKAVKYWRTEYAKLQRERDEMRVCPNCGCAWSSEPIPQPQREGDYL